MNSVYFLALIVVCVVAPLGGMAWCLCVVAKKGDERLRNGNPYCRPGCKPCEEVRKHQAETMLQRYL